MKMVTYHLSPFAPFVIGCIPDAINIPNDIIGTAQVSELHDKEPLILIYCHSGKRSMQAAVKLAALGYTNIVEFGGINDWPRKTVSDGEQAWFR